MWIVKFHSSSGVFRSYAIQIGRSDFVKYWDISSVKNRQACLEGCTVDGKYLSINGLGNICQEMSGADFGDYNIIFLITDRSVLRLFPGVRPEAIKTSREIHDSNRRHFSGAAVV